MNQLTNCQTGIKTKSILNMVKIELVTRTCATCFFWVGQKPIVVSDYCDYNTFVIIAQKIKIKCTLAIIAQKGHFTAQKCALLEHKNCTFVIIYFLCTLQHKKVLCYSTKSALS